MEEGGFLFLGVCLSVLYNIVKFRDGYPVNETFFYPFCEFMLCVTYFKLELPLFKDGYIGFLSCLCSIYRVLLPL